MMIGKSRRGINRETNTRIALTVSQIVVLGVTCRYWPAPTVVIVAIFVAWEFFRKLADHRWPPR